MDILEVLAERRGNSLVDRGDALGGSWAFGRRALSRPLTWRRGVPGRKLGGGGAPTGRPERLLLGAVAPGPPPGCREPWPGGLLQGGAESGLSFGVFPPLLRGRLPGGFNSGRWPNCTEGFFILEAPTARFFFGQGRVRTCLGCLACKARRPEPLDFQFQLRLGPSQGSALVSSIVAWASGTWRRSGGRDVLELRSHAGSDRQSRPVLLRPARSTGGSCSTRRRPAARLPRPRADSSRGEHVIVSSRCLSSPSARAIFAAPAWAWGRIQRNTRDLPGLVTGVHQAGRKTPTSTNDLPSLQEGQRILISAVRSPDMGR